MVTLSIGQVADVWRRNGGRADRTALMVAVAMAESSGRTEAISPSSDYGLWQINSGNFPGLGLDGNTALDPDLNAQAAIRLSGSGVDIHDWATAYNPPPPPWLGSMSSPQPGSPVADWLPSVESQLGLVSQPAPGRSLPPGCGPGDIGIPNSAVAGLAVGASVLARTCPGGAFDAGDLQDWLSVSFELNGEFVTYTNGWRGYFIPPDTDVRITRTGPLPTPPLPGVIGGPLPPYPVTPPPTPPPGQQPPPASPPPGFPPGVVTQPVPPGAGGQVSPPPGPGRAGLQTSWTALVDWTNQRAPGITESFANQSNYVRSRF